MLNIFRKKGGTTTALSSEKDSKRKETRPIQGSGNGSTSTPTKSKEEEEEANGAAVQEVDESDKGKEEDKEVERGDADGNGTVDDGAIIASRSLNDTADAPSGTKSNGEVRRKRKKTRCER